MNIARNLITPQTGNTPVGVAGRAGEGIDEHLPTDVNAIDWQALRSRLFAAHDMLGVLGSDAKATRLRLRGSFAGGTATALHAYEEALRTVNLDVSTNGKPDGDTVSPVAGVNGNGERG